MNFADRIKTGWTASALIMGAMVFSAPAEGYLPRIGPSGFRFLPPASERKDFVFPPENALSSTQPAAAAEHSATNASPVAFDVPSTSQLPAPAIESLLPQPLPSPNEPTPSSSANELLIISPQMLMEYLKPNPGGTNAAASALVPVTFTPATPSAAPVSRAIYKTE